MLPKLNRAVCIILLDMSFSKSAIQRCFPPVRKISTSELCEVLLDDAKIHHISFLIENQSALLKLGDGIHCQLSENLIKL